MNPQRHLRNFRTLGLMTIAAACFSSALAQRSYKITDLGVNKNSNNFAMAMGLNKWGWTENMDGFVNAPETSTSTTIANGRAVISIYGLNVDLGTLGKPSANSWINWGGINDRGDAAGLSETSEPDPNGEDVCGFRTHLICAPFIWRDFHMSALPTLGGNNGQASAINNLDEVVGFAEDGTVDSTCPAGTMNDRTQLPALWRAGKVEALPLVPHDVDGFAYGNNDQGDAVGYSGNCSAATHAVAWKDHNVIPLQDLGGAGFNFAYAINKHGQIVGQVGVGDGIPFYSAVWQDGARGSVTIIGTLPGDYSSFATGINSRGEVVGNDFDSTFNWARGFIWKDGKITDLNTLISSDSNLSIISASNINDSGQISGMATVQSGPHANEVHAYLLTPSEDHIGVSMAEFARTHPQSILSANACNHSSQRFGPGRLQR